MICRKSAAIFCLLMACTGGFTAAQRRVPKCIYTNFIVGDTINSAQTAAYPNTNDVIYASGLAGCTMQQITGSPASPANLVAIPPDVSACIVRPFSSTWLSVLTTQAEMDLASLSQLLIAEPPLP